MYVDAEERLEELMHLNEQSGPAFKIKEDHVLQKSEGLFARQVLMNCHSFLMC